MEKTNIKDPLTLIRSTFLVGLVSMGQVAAFMFLYSAVAEFYTITHGQLRSDLNFGIGLHYSLYLLGGLAAGNAIVQIFAERTGIKWLATIIATLLWLSYWGSILPQMPNRFLLVSVAGLTSFAFAMMFLYRIPTEYATNRRFDVV